MSDARLGTGDNAGQNRKDIYALTVLCIDIWENGGHHLQGGVMVKLGLGDVMVVKFGLHMSQMQRGKSDDGAEYEWRSEADLRDPDLPYCLQNWIA